VVDGQGQPNERNDDEEEEGGEEEEDKEEALDYAAFEAFLLQAETKQLAGIATAKSLVKLTRKTLERKRANNPPHLEEMVLYSRGD
jgi:hypothetical protein